jgi:hypothetical protein
LHKFRFENQYSMDLIFLWRLGESTTLCDCCLCYVLVILFYFCFLLVSGSLFFLLPIFLNYISNAIPKVPHTLPPTSLPTLSQLFKGSQQSVLGAQELRTSASIPACTFSHQEKHGLGPLS